MAHILRLHNGVNTNQDWTKTSDTYAENVIDAIQDPDGGNATKQITSIPSPFARIDLIKTAFKEVNKLGVDGKTIYHKMVSDTLDVAEIFFNHEKFKDKFEIITWKLSDLNNLRVEHREVVDSLKIFYEQDSKTYNFDRLGELYILRYKGQYKKTGLDVVGATSPSTLFFTPANDLSYISPDINFGQDQPFDGSYQPLYKRDFEFVKYFYLFRKEYNNNNGHIFAKDFPELNAYLEETYPKLDNGSRNIIDNFSVGAWQNYQILQCKSNNRNNDVTILGCPWRCKSLLTNVQSDFEIAYADKYRNKLPLVLPVKAGTTYRDYYYVQGTFGSGNAAPYSDKEVDLNKRKLPHDGTPYPYLTIGDFLEDTMYVYDGEVNNEKYYFGEWNNGNKAVLLPLKPRFFDFFTVDQLINGIDGTKLLEIQDEESNIYVKLSIPIKGKDGRSDFMRYEKNYYSSRNEGDETRGSIVKLEDSFGFSMMPLVRFNQESNAHYRIGLITGQSDKKEYSLGFYSVKNSLLNNNDPIKRNVSDNNYSKLSVYSIEKSNIDYIHITIGNSGGGIILPIMKDENSIENYNFAIDFGTTNTHIEYNTNQNATERAFDITENDIQINYWAKYEDCNIEAYSMFESDFLPQMIGNNEEFHFPTRTALSASKAINWDTAKIMADNNFSFTYGYRVHGKYNQILTDLKWDNDGRKMEKAIGNLMFLIRNKVLLNDGSLENTKIIWSYPTSMNDFKKEMVKECWRKAYRDYFGGNCENISEIIEALAPHKFYDSTRSNRQRVVNVDIGGGTTDVIFADGTNVHGSTSFRFAANSIFGTGYVENKELNGLINYYLSFFEQKFEEHELENCKQIHKSLMGEKDSVNIASFYFSLIDNKDVKEKEIEDVLNWNTTLRYDADYKIIFVFFYTAIMYHVANIMRMKSFPMPRHISFSGNGSKVVSILSSDNRIIAEYTKAIFTDVYGKEYHKDGLNVDLGVDPKVATCKGGLIHLNRKINNAQKEGSQGNENDVQEIGEKIVLLTDRFIDNKDVYEKVNYEDEKNKTISDINRLVEFIKSKSHFLKDKFGVNLSILNIIKWECDIEAHFDEGIKRKREESGNVAESIIEETFFFYPIIGKLYDISNQILEHKNNNKL